MINAPICLSCWYKQNPHREPYSLKNPEPEKCYYCGVLTKSGIYVRATKLYDQDA